MSNQQTIGQIQLWSVSQIIEFFIVMINTNQLGPWDKKWNKRKVLQKFKPTIISKPTTELAPAPTRLTVNYLKLETIFHYYFQSVFRFRSVSSSTELMAVVWFPIQLPNWQEVSNLLNLKIFCPISVVHFI